MQPRQQAIGTAMIAAFALLGACGNAVDSGNPPLPRFVELTTGFNHSCALTEDSKAFCWGNNEFGQLGTPPSQSDVRGESRPRLVISTKLFVKIDAGEVATCVIDEGGSAYCWGRNQWGQLGIGSQTSATSPQAVVGGHLFSAIDVAESHACALELNGKAYCWGNNAQGALGATTPQAVSSTPVAVLGNQSWQALRVGQEFSCGLTAAGTAYCWGINAVHQLGNGSAAPQPSPSLVSGNLTFKALTVGHAHACALTTGGLAHCWGWNQHGQLGDGTVINRSSPTAVSGSLQFSAIRAGYWHTCGLTSSGDAYCWGNNSYGEVGDGTDSPTPKASPTQVLGALTFTSIATGAWRTCGITAGGDSYCWGVNGYGELGNGTWSNSNVPTKVTP